MPATSLYRIQHSYSGLLIVRAAILCCALTLATSAVFAQAASQPASKHGAASAPQSKAKQNQSTPGLDTSSLEKTIREVVKEASEKHDPHADAHLQSEGHLVEYTRQLAVDTNRLAKFTLWLFAVTGLMVLVVAGQLWMFKRQLGLMEADSKSTQNTAAAARKSAEASILELRPWLNCKVKIIGPLTFNEAGDAVFRFSISVRNVGHSPAMSVQVYPHLLLSAEGVKHSILQLQDHALLIRGLGVQKPPPAVPYSEPPPGALLYPVGTVLFPNERYRVRYQIPIRREDLDKACQKTDKHFWPELTVLVSYVYAAAEERADTGFVFNIERTDVRDPLRLDEELPPESLTISQHHSWGGWVS